MLKDLIMTLHRICCIGCLNCGAVGNIWITRSECLNPLTTRLSQLFHNWCISHTSPTNTSNQSGHSDIPQQPCPVYGRWFNFVWGEPPAVLGRVGATVRFFFSAGLNCCQCGTLVNSTSEFNQYILYSTLPTIKQRPWGCLLLYYYYTINSQETLSMDDSLCWLLFYIYHKAVR